MIAKQGTRCTGEITLPSSAALRARTDVDLDQRWQSHNDRAKVWSRANDQMEARSIKVINFRPWSGTAITASGISPREEDADDHECGRGDHAPCDRLMQQQAGERETEERLELLQLADARDAADR